MSFRHYLARFRQSLQAGRSTRRPRHFARRPLLESLEDRTLLSIILWTNRGGPGSDTDNFQATYGSLATATTARAIVDRAINDWQTVIQNFNYAGGGNTYSLTINAMNLGDGGRGVTTGIATDAAGKPTSATITMDDDGGGAGWFFDTTPNDDAEFTILLNAFAANGPNTLNGNDFYRTIVHEMGHAMGIVQGGAQAINTFLTNSGFLDPVDGVSTLFLFTGATTQATLTSNGGGHIYEGPVVGTVPIAPFDLMNAGRTVGFPPPTRELITDLDAEILRDAYNYTIQLPSTINTFFANLNRTTGVLTVNGAPGTSNDNILIDVNGGVRVQVNGTVETFPGAVVTSINVLAGAGNDAVTIGNGLAGIPITIDGGDGNDTLIAGDADITIMGGNGDDTIIGGPGNDSLDGGAGNDVIFGLGGNDTITGGSGNDMIYAGTGNNVVSDGSGDDFVDLSQNSVAVTYVTGGGNDTVIGTPFNDVIIGSSGNDRLEGRGGNDTLIGGPGNDQLFGGDGVDTLVWNNGDGSDVMEGGDGIDQVVVNGSAVADVFTASANGARVSLNLGSAILDIAGVEQLNLNTAGGADVVTLNDLTPTELQVVNVDVGAGDGAADAVTVNGRSVADNLLINVSGGVVGVTGLSYTVKVSSATTIDTLTVNGNDGDDSINAAAGVESTIAIVLNGGNGNDFLSADGTLNGGAGNDTLIGGAGNDTLNGGDGDDLLDGRGGNNSLDGGGGTDTILVSGTAGPDMITTNQPAAGMFNVLGGLSAGNNTISNIEAVRIEAGDGADNITVNVLAAGGLNYTVLGGNPIGAPGDTLTVNSSATMTVTPGPTNDSGSVDAATTTPTNVSYREIELLVISGGGGGAINGTNGNDVITVIARDSSFNGGADGIQDFTVSVNAGPDILFLNVANLTVNALNGDDKVVLHAPAPNNAAWNVNVTVNGGASSAVGDQLVVETPFANQATYTPSASNAGTLVVLNGVNPITNVTITDIENFVYDGQSGGDSFTLVGTSAANAFRLTPGAANDAGTLSMDSTLPVTFQNLGATGQVVVNGNGGADSLTYYGTAANDSFTVATSVLGGQVNLNARVPLLTANVATLTLEGVAGDDTFTLVPTVAASPYTTLNLHGGPPATPAGSQANLTAAAGADVAVSGQVVTQSGKVVAGSGLANINLNGAGNHLVYNGVAGVHEDVNVIASATAAAGQVSVPGVVLLTFVNVPTVDVNGNAADSDTLMFTGTNNSDTFQINLAAAGTDADPVLKLQTAAAATLLTLRNYTGFSTLNMQGLDGLDTFNVVTGPTAPGGGRNLFIDGNLPGGHRKTIADVLNVFYVHPRPHIVHSFTSQDHDAGIVDLDYGTARFLIQYDGIENVTIGQL
jgi:Ca2+-binding RTX toxin-like protein